MHSLTGRAAVVTGSTSGIGRAIARTLAESGAAVVLNGFGDAEDIERLRCELQSLSGTATAYCGSDVSTPAGVAQLFARAHAEVGPVDILICNAGIQHVAPIEDFPPDKWDAILALDLSSAFHAMRLALPSMRHRGWGRIISIASVHGLVASPFKSAYVAAKHGLVGLTRVAALETAESGVTVNAICPGYVLTPLVERQIPQQAAACGVSEEAVIRDVLLSAQPNKQFVGTDEIAALALFLCSDAARSITGAAISIDGGWTAR